jgi:hypothetical protein
MKNAIRVTALAGIVLVAGLSLLQRTATAQSAPARPAATVTSLPERLSDAEFWTLERDLSEPGGYFRITDNYTSNEREVGQLITMLGERGISGGVYLGVGPEQNLSYIAAIRPAMAFVVDIRRQAVMQHLMFKAVFELAKDRADFISLLFSKPRPADLDGSTPIQQIWGAYERVSTDPQLASKNAARIVEHLTRTHKFAFTAEEADELTSVLAAFVEYGPAISTRGYGGGGGFGGSGGTFAELTGWSLDAAGQPQSFLSTEEHFRTVKALEASNLLVPVSGDFGGPKAIRAIGAYLHEHGGTVSAFYVSNVEQYLFQDGKDRAFYANVAALPLGDGSVFIRPYSLRRGVAVAEPLCPMLPFLAAVHAGRVPSNGDALACAP